ncbi:hypothetical protein [Coleofasciculus sp. FACHB-SPT9]|uniref:hypothetical protein n=1 Tax=Cyanophyceae TaxID=3028117 RepID=UPI001685863A|nr:hypothetical protein [Coleofasciculus sp. FACHB-SPT9]MBD1892230.1 hypothetical protein [Coleofasciculus sp. FACHB-SPT9]
MLTATCLNRRQSVFASLRVPLLDRESWLLQSPVPGEAFPEDGVEISSTVQFSAVHQCFELHLLIVRSLITVD